MAQAARDMRHNGRFHLDDRGIRYCDIFPEIENSTFSGNEYSQKILNEEGICLSPGECFGENGKGFLRLSYSQTPIETIQIAIEKIKKFHNKYF